MTKKVQILVGGGILVIAIGVLALQDRASNRVEAAEPTTVERQADIDAINAATKSFIQSFESGDAKTVSAHWTTEGEYIDDEGTSYRGRANIEKAYEQVLDKNRKFKVTIESTSLRFLSRDTAMEEGYFKVQGDAKTHPTTSKYSLLHVREDGKWLLGVVREWAGEGMTVRDLDWLIGSWSADKNGVQVRTTFEWTADKSFIKGTYTISEKGQKTTTMQMIAEDSSAGLIRSWTFETGGGFAEATWTRDGNKWTVEAAGVQPGAKTSSATNVLTRIDNDTFIWQTMAQTVGEDELPGTPPVKVTRVKQ